MTPPAGPTCHEFVLVLDRYPREQDWDWLADAAPDAAFTIPDDGGPAYGSFDIVGRDLAEAIAEAIRNLATAGFQVVGVGPVDRLLDVEIPDRAGKSWPHINGIIERSPVAHPKPMHDERGYYLWPQVAQWLAAHGVPQRYDQTIEAADATVKALHAPAHGSGGLAEHIRRGVRRLNPWQMPEWMEPYRSFIAETGGNEVGDLLDRLDLEPRLGLTNLPVFALGIMVRAQVGLLERLHADGCLPAAPNGDGGWGR